MYSIPNFSIPNPPQCSETAGSLIVPQYFETAAPSDQENVYIEKAASSSGNLWVESSEIEKLDEEPYHEDEFYEEEEIVDTRSDFVVGIAKWVGGSNLPKKKCNLFFKLSAR